MSRRCPVAIDLCARVTCLASALGKRDSRRVSKRALAHLRADPTMAGLIDRIGPVKLRPRRLPPFQALTSDAKRLAAIALCLKKGSGCSGPCSPKAGTKRSR